MAGENTSLFGVIALRSDLINQEQLKEALELQEQHKKEKKSLGDILVTMGAIGHLDKKHVLDVQKLMRTSGERARFGIAAMQNGYATREQVEEVLGMPDCRNADTQVVGNIMVREGVISEEQRQALLKGLSRLEGDNGAPRSRLVQAIRRIDEGGAVSIQYESAEAMMLAECARLIKEGVKGLAHIGILSEARKTSGEKISGKQLITASEADKAKAESAIEDLVVLNALEEHKGLLGTKYTYCPDAALARRIDVLLSTMEKPELRGELLNALQQ